MVFSWFFRGFFVALFCLEKQCSGLFRYFFVVFSWLFRGFFVAPVLGKFYAYSPWNSLLSLAFLTIVWRRRIRRQTSMMRIQRALLLRPAPLNTGCGLQHCFAQTSRLDIWPGTSQRNRAAKESAEGHRPALLLNNKYSVLTCYLPMHHCELSSLEEPWSAQAAQLARADSAVLKEVLICRLAVSSHSRLDLPRWSRSFDLGGFRC